VSRGLTELAILAAVSAAVALCFDYTSKLGMWGELAILWGAAAAVWVLCWIDHRHPVTEDPNPTSPARFLLYFVATIGCIVLVANVAKWIGKLIGSDYI
jgi:hypothetical protein